MWRLSSHGGCYGKADEEPRYPNSHDTDLTEENKHVVVLLFNLRLVYFKDELLLGKKWCSGLCDRLQTIIQFSGYSTIESPKLLILLENDGH